MLGMRVGIEVVRLLDDVCRVEGLVMGGMVRMREFINSMLLILSQVSDAVRSRTKTLLFENSFGDLSLGGKASKLVNTIVINATTSTSSEPSYGSMKIADFGIINLKAQLEDLDEGTPIITISSSTKLLSFATLSSVVP
jgi:hypothetical protein